MTTIAYEVWLAESAAAMTSTVETVRASSERDAFRKAREQHPDMLVRGVYEIDTDDPGIAGLMGGRS